jgi:tryptophan synthase alpha chain
MNRLRQSFAELRATGRKTLVPYITAGYPDAGTTVEIIRRLSPERIGCVELGIPFSDPIADGPVIQTSFSRALDGGFRVSTLLHELEAARADIRVPLVTMVSYSVIYRRGPEAFIAAARTAGIDGMLVPDLSIEEADALAALGRQHDFPLIQIVAPTSDAERRRRIVALSEPWIYYQSLAGVTGERSALPPDLATHVAALRRETDKPVCVGFGVARPEQVAAVCELADGAIVGSAIVRRMNEAVERGERGAELAGPLVEFIESLAAAVP